MPNNKATELEPSRQPHPEPGSTDNLQLLTQLHIAEYQALTTRATYFITIMAGIFPLFALYIAIVAQVIKPYNGAFIDALLKLLTAPNGVRAAFLWGNFFVFQMMTNVFEQLLLEQYGIVLYLESKLRPLVGQHDFWNYERFQFQAKKTVSRFGEIASLLLVSLCLLLAVYNLPHFILWDYIGLGANMLLLAWLTLNTINVVRTRLEWEKIMRLSPATEIQKGEAGDPPLHPR
jgi:hypothetical protein